MKEWHSGWINVVNPSAPRLCSAPVPGKSFAVVNNFLKQQIDKGFALYCYGAPVKVDVIVPLARIRQVFFENDLSSPTYLSTKDGRGV